jgi:hypothetical protein
LEGKAVARKLTDLYPSNFNGYSRLAVIARQEGRYGEAAEYFATTIRLAPRAPTIKNFYWNTAVCLIWAGNNRGGLEWADRAMVAAGDLLSLRPRGW